jgi:putative glycosyltransferase (TIGR04372 family)
MKPLLRKSLKIAGIVTVIPALIVLRPFWRIKIGHLYSSRIGHLIANTEVFLRQQAADRNSGNDTVILISGAPSNRTLLDLYGRQTKIVESRFLSCLYMQLAPILKKFGLHQDLDFNDYDYHKLFNSSRPNLVLSTDEKFSGAKLLESLGINRDDWYVCIHARDDTYLEQHLPDHDWSTHSVRNCSISKFQDAVEVIHTFGGHIVRMGATPSSPKLETVGRQIVPYSPDVRSDFSDVFLAANCRFFLGCTSGLYMTAWGFGRPVAITNLLPVGAGPWSTNDLYIPKLFKRKSTGEMVHFDEILDLGLIGRASGNHHAAIYASCGLEVVENSSVDIAALCREMFQLSSGEENSAEDQKLQEAFCRRYLGWLGDPCYLSRPAASFLRAHESLFSL